MQFHVPMDGEKSVVLSLDLLVFLNIIHKPAAARQH